MYWHPNVFSITLGILVLLTLGIAFYTWRNRNLLEANPTFLLIAVAIWSFGYTVALGVYDLPARLFWAKVQHIGIALSPIAMSLFAIQFSGRKEWLKWWRLGLIGLIPAVGLLLVWTNDAHHLIWKTVQLEIFNSMALLKIEYGPYLYLYALYNYSIVVVLIILFIREFIRAPHLRRRQVGVLIFGFSLALIVNMISLLGLSPIPGLDLAPFGHTFGALCLAWGVFRYGMFNLVPVARETVLEHLRDGLIVLDARGRILDMNPVMRELIRLPIEKVIGKSSQAVFSERSDGLQLLAHKLDEQAAYTNITIGEKTERRDFDLSVSPLNNRRGNIVGQVIVLRNITRLVQSENSLREANAALQQAQAQVVEQQRAVATLEERERLARELHDGIGQVLGYINVQAQSARDSVNTNENEAAVRLLTRLVEVAQEAHDDVRGYILGLKKETSAPQHLDFFAMLDQYCQHLFQTYGFRVAVNLPADPPSKLAATEVETQLLYIIREALSNARSHSGKSEADVSITFDESAVRAVIEDQGTGIAYAGSERRKGAHFGLGIMRERAEQVGGALEVASAPGSGTRVTVRLPRQLEAESTPGRRVLLVDDHPLFLEGLTNLLTGRGLTVIGTASDGIEAQEQARKLHPDVILMDIQMPRCDGLEATRRIKAEMPEVKVVMLTVSGEEQHLFEALQSGASGYLLKSLEAAELTSLLEELLRGEVSLSPSLANKMLEAFTRRKSPEARPPTIREATGTAGEIPAAELTDRQSEILRLVSQGLTYKEIALKLGLAEVTIKYHMGEILARLHLTSRRDAVRYVQVGKLNSR